MNLIRSNRSAAKVLVPAVLTVAILAGLIVFQRTGLFDQIGRVATCLVIAGDLFVLVLVWIRAMR